MPIRKSTNGRWDAGRSRSRRRPAKRRFSTRPRKTRPPTFFAAACSSRSIRPPPKRLSPPTPRRGPGTRARCRRASLRPELKNQFRRGYPLHPETLAVLTEKTASLSNFQRIRGMVRLLSRAVHVLWRDKPVDAFAIHPHHIDPGYTPIRDEITTRLGQSEYTPALKSDVAAVAGDDPGVAQKLDKQFYPGQLPITAYIARTIFLNSLGTAKRPRGSAWSICGIRFVRRPLSLASSNRPASGSSKSRCTSTTGRPRDAADGRGEPGTGHPPPDDRG